MIRLAGVGVGGSSKVIYDVVNQYLEYDIVGWFDDDASKIGSNHLNLQVIDTVDNIDKHKKHFDLAIICVGATKNTIARNSVYNKLKSKNIELVTLVSKKSIVSPSAKISAGCIILDGVIVNSSCVLSENVFLNTACVIEHDVTIGQSCFISPKAVLCGNVSLEDNVFVGANSTTLGNISVGSRSVIGAGSVVISNVPKDVTVVGNPAKNLNR